MLFFSDHGMNCPWFTFLCCYWKNICSQDSFFDLYVGVMPQAFIYYFQHKNCHSQSSCDFFLTVPDVIMDLRYSEVVTVLILSLSFDFVHGHFIVVIEIQILILVFTMLFHI